MLIRGPFTFVNGVEHSGSRGSGGRFRGATEAAAWILARYKGGAYDSGMSAGEIIEQSKALPQHERYANGANFEAAAPRVFETHDELLRRVAE